MKKFLKLEAKPTTLKLSRTKYIQEGAITLTANNILFSYFPNCKCCCNGKLIHKASGWQYHNTQYNKGVEKLKSESDCVEFIKSMWKLSILFKIVLDKNQQILANFASQQVLDSSKKLTKKIESAGILSSVLWKHCNKNDDPSSCKTVGRSNLYKSQFPQKIDELFNDYSVKHINHADKVIIDEIWEPKSAFNPVRIAFE